MSSSMQPISPNRPFASQILVSLSADSSEVANGAERKRGRVIREPNAKKAWQYNAPAPLMPQMKRRKSSQRRREDSLIRKDYVRRGPKRMRKNRIDRDKLPTYRVTTTGTGQGMIWNGKSVIQGFPHLRCGPSGARLAELAARLTRLKQGRSGRFAEKVAAQSRVCRSLRAGATDAGRSARLHVESEFDRTQLQRVHGFDLHPRAVEPLV